MARRHAFSGLFLIGQRVRVGVRVRFGSWGLKAFPGQRKRYGGLAASYRGLSRHLLAFIFVLGLLFIFFMPFFTVVAVFQGCAAVCGARWRRRAELFVLYIFFCREGCAVTVSLVVAVDGGLGRGSKSWSKNKMVVDRFPAFAETKPIGWQSCFERSQRLK